MLVLLKKEKNVNKVKILKQDRTGWAGPDGFFRTRSRQLAGQTWAGPYGSFDKHNYANIHWALWCIKFSNLLCILMWTIVWRPRKNEATSAGARKASTTDPTVYKLTKQKQTTSKETMAAKEKETSQNCSQPEESEEKLINIAAFFVYGVVVTTMGMLFLSTAEDLLSGTSFPSTLILISSIAPYFLCTALLPYFVERVTLLAVNMVVFMFYMAGLLFITLPAQTELKILGICCCGLGLGVGDVFFLGHTARYGDVTVRAYSGGTGVGFIFSNLYYTGKSRALDNVCWFLCFVITGFLIIVSRWIKEISRSVGRSVNLFVTQIYSRPCRIVKSRADRLRGRVTFPRIPLCFWKVFTIPDSANWQNTSKAGVKWSHISDFSRAIVSLPCTWRHTPRDLL